MWLSIEHTDQAPITIYMPAIFPVDEAIEIGEVTKEYTLTKSFSVKTPKLTKPLMGFNLPFDIPVTGGVDLASKEQKKINYGLRIPKVISGTASNNDAAWKYYLGEALDPKAQYRTDMTVGLPLIKSKNYKVKMVLTVTTKGKLGFDPKPVEHTAPIKFSFL